MRSMKIWAILAVVALTILNAQQSAARCGDVWLVSSHRVPSGCYCPGESPPLRVWRLADECRWTDSDLSSLWGTSDPGVPTLILVHGFVGGGDTAIERAIQGTWPIYRRLCCDAQARPFRIIIWTWPAERTLRGLRDRTIRGIRADGQRKAARTDTESVLLAQLIAGTHPRVPLTLAGYSFGARIVAGSLHLLGGGQLRGCRLADEQLASRVPARAMLVGAAMDCDWLLPGHRHGRALSQVDRLLITVNHRDGLLKLYRHLYRLRGPQALGRVGPAGLACLGAERAKFELLNTTCTVGKEHHWDNYLFQSGILGRLDSYLFREPLRVTAVGATWKEDAAATKIHVATRSPAAIGHAPQFGERVRCPVRIQRRAARRVRLPPATPVRLAR